MAKQLPSEFSDLAEWSDWILASEQERYAKRLSSSMDEIQAFYDAVVGRIDDIMAYSSRILLDDGPVSDEDRNLAYLAFSFVTASFPVEAWKQPHVPDSGASAFPLVSEPGF